MTEAEIIAHWRKRAGEALDAARILHTAGKDSDALFHCHLAVEKGLKAAIMEKTGQPHPKIHDLLTLAGALSRVWTEEDQDVFDSLSDFAVAARYDDPDWAQRCATPANVASWIDRADRLLSRILP